MLQLHSKCSPKEKALTKGKGGKERGKENIRIREGKRRGKRKRGEMFSMFLKFSNNLRALPSHLGNASAKAACGLLGQPLCTQATATTTG